MAIQFQDIPEQLSMKVLNALASHLAQSAVTQVNILSR
jgi:hypothetical protein